MSSSPTLLQVDKLVYRGGDGPDVEDILEENVEDSDEHTLEADKQRTGAKYQRPSVYVKTLEDMINTVYEQENHLLTPYEWQSLGRLSELEYDARYCFARLILRKPDQWHTAASMETFKREIGDSGLIPALKALCIPFEDEPSPNMEGSEPWTKKEEEGEVSLAVKEEELEVPLRIEREVIDLTLDSDDENSNSSYKTPPPSPRKPTRPPPQDYAVAEPSRLIVEDCSPSQDISLLKLGYFCRDECSMNLFEILSRLSVEQLKELAKAMKVKILKQRKPGIIQALLSSSLTQSVLNFANTPKRSTKTPESKLRQTTLAFTSIAKNEAPKVHVKSQEDRLRQLALKRLGKCIQVNNDYYQLIHRLHIIYFRCTEYPTSILTPALLTSFKKRTYPEYQYRRDGTIWQTRQDVLEYEAALQLEAELDAIQEMSASSNGGSSWNGRETKTPDVMRNHLMTPITPRNRSKIEGSSSLTTPLKTPITLGGGDGESASAVEDSANCVDTENMELDIEIMETEPLPVKKARQIKDIFEERIYPKWLDLVATQREEGVRNRPPGLDRFETGHVYTRMVNKGLRALATLKEFQFEAEVVEQLLGQRFWRRGKRARWYDRRALLYTQYLSKRPDGNKKDMKILRKALEGLKDALLDDDTGIVLRPQLFRRIQKLEKQLQIPEVDRCQCEGGLRKANVVSFRATRIHQRKDTIRLDPMGLPIKAEASSNGDSGIHQTPGNEQQEKSTSAGITTYFCATGRDQAPEPGFNDGKGKEKPKSNKWTGFGTDGWKWKGKSLWKGDDGEEVNVEMCALQYYESHGYKGFHSETSILTTLFGLLFWDILFADIQGAFETKFQTGPMDLAGDSFYRARKVLIDDRIEEIERGKAKDIIERHDSLYRPKETWCVGVNWGLCEPQDLIEIVECIGGKPLAIICRLFCEDYVGRSSGVPDLIVWDAAQGVCKFVEVKGPGDTPSENQKLWFDALLGAGTNVEICRVIDASMPIEGDKKPKKVRKTPVKAKTPRKVMDSITRKRKRGDTECDDEAEEETKDQLVDDSSDGPPRRLMQVQANSQVPPVDVFVCDAASVPKKHTFFTTIEDREYYVGSDQESDVEGDELPVFRRRGSTAPPLSPPRSQNRADDDESMASSRKRRKLEVTGS